MDSSGGTDNSPFLNHNWSVCMCFVCHRACCERQKDALSSGTLHVLRKLTENLKTTGTHTCTHMCPLTAVSFIRGRMDQRWGKGGFKATSSTQGRCLILGQEDLRCCLFGVWRVDGHTRLHCLTGVLWVYAFPPETTKDTHLQESSGQMWSFTHGPGLL